MLRWGWNAALNTAVHVTHFTGQTWALTAIPASLHSISATFHVLHRSDTDSMEDLVSQESGTLYLIVFAAVWKSADRSHCLYWWQSRAQRLHKQNQSFQVIVTNLTPPLSLSLFYAVSMIQLDLSNWKSERLWDVVASNEKRTWSKSNCCSYIAGPQIYLTIALQ